MQVNTGQIHKRVNLTDRKKMLSDSMFKCQLTLSNKGEFTRLIYIIVSSMLQLRHSNLVMEHPARVQKRSIIPSVPCISKDAQAVKLSLKRTVWGVVTSATASSCPSDKPSSTLEEANIHYVLL